jgi:hypothetical protein
MPSVATIDDAVLAEGQGAGLVEDHDVEVARLLEPAPVAHQEPVLRAERGRDRDHQRHGEAEGVRTGDDQHGDDAGDGEVERGAEASQTTSVSSARRRSRRG